MELVPVDIYKEIITKLSHANLLNFCNVNKIMSTLFSESNEEFWHIKTINDYKKMPRKPENMSWKRFYVELGTTNNFIKSVSMEYISRIDFDGDDLYVSISKPDSAEDLLRQIVDIFAIEYKFRYMTKNLSTIIGKNRDHKDVLIFKYSKLTQSLELVHAAPNYFDKITSILLFEY